jgi:hypothetical protein
MLLVEGTMSVLILDQFKFSCDFELLMTKEVDNWVKVWNYLLVFELHHDSIQE